MMFRAQLKMNLYISVDRSVLRACNQAKAWVSRMRGDLPYAPS